MKILYEGVDIYPDISVHRCYHDMYAEKQSDELLLKLNDTRELWDSWNPKKGDTIAIEDGAAKTGKMFVESVVPESGIITLRAYSIPQSAKDKRSKSWEKVKFLQLAQEIAGRHSLTLETYGITDQTYDYVEQNNLADFAFFQNRCTLEGAAFLVYDGKLVVYDEAYMESQQPVDTITITITGGSAGMGMNLSTTQAYVTFGSAGISGMGNMGGQPGSFGGMQPPQNGGQPKSDSKVSGNFQPSDDFRPGDMTSNNISAATATAQAGSDNSSGNAI